jgi:hypothetical protein
MLTIGGAERSVCLVQVQASEPVGAPRNRHLQRPTRDDFTLDDRGNDAHVPPGAT